MKYDYSISQMDGVIMEASGSRYIIEISSDTHVNIYDYPKKEGARCGNWSLRDVLGHFNSGDWRPDVDTVKSPSENYPIF